MSVAWSAPAPPSTPRVGAFTMGMDALGAVTSAIGSYYQAVGQRTALQMAADASRFNAQIAEVNARASLEMGNTNAALSRGLGEFNAGMALGVADLNARLMTGFADMNSAIADGHYNVILARGDMEAGIAERNAQILEMRADEAIRVGQDQQQTVMINTAALKSSQRARLAANGVVLDSDTGVRILTGTDWMEERDTDTLHNNAVREALGYHLQAGNERLKGAMARAGAAAEGLAYKAQAMGAKMQSKMDVMNLQLNAAFTSQNYLQQGQLEALNFTTTAQFDAINSRTRARNFASQGAGLSLSASGISPLGSAASSLMDSAAQVAARWYSYSRAGMI